MSASAPRCELTVSQAEASAFVPVDLQQPLREYEVEMGLIIEAPVFKEGNKWKFHDGQTSFWAEIADQSFLAQVDSGAVRFGKGDMMIARVRVSQVTGLGTINTQRSIVSVVELRPAMQQQQMF